MLLWSMALQSCTSNLKLDTGPVASQPQASKKPLRRFVGGEQHPQDKPMSISASTENAPAVPAAPQVAPAASLFIALPPSSFPPRTAVLPFPKTVLYNQRLSQGTAITQSPKNRIGRQGLLSGMMQGFEEKKESGLPQEDEEQKEAFPQEQRALGGSLLKLRPSEHQGPTALELAQKEATALKKVIKEQYGLLISQDREAADPQLVSGLLADLEQLLGLEALWTLEESEDSAQEYLVRLRNDDGLPLYGADVRERLMVLLERAYVQALKGAVSTTLLKGPSNLSHEEQERLAAALGQLAAFHQEQGRQTGDLSLYTDAAILYQHMLQVCEGEAEEAYRGLAEIKAAMIAKCKQGKARLSSRVSSDELQEEIARDKQILQDLRVEAKRRVAELEAAEMSDEGLYIEQSKALFAEIAQRVGAFLGRLYQESEDELGPAPCKYTVMGLGSMALQQMTPYSDLEFAILTEGSGDAATLDKYRAYFRELSHLVHLRVINLGETVMPRSKYGVSLDYLGKRGINFDLGGKTPLGRKDKPYLKKPYELIQPVAGMMRYLRNEGDKSTNMDKLLPFILERTCYVHGDPGLHAAYVAQKSVFFASTQTEQGVPVYQARALQKLLEGVVEMDYSHAGAGIAKSGQPGDLADFKPKFGYEDTGRLYDVKQEIYRLPDRLLYRLAMYYGLLPESGWDAVAQLSSRGIITREAAQHLGYAVSFATMLRLKTYLHQGQQGESMTVLGGMSQEAAQQFFVLSKESLQEGGSLFQYYYTALPLHVKMEAFFKGREGDFSPIQEEDFFQEESFYNDSYSVRGRIHQRVMQHAAAKTCYKKALEMYRAFYPGNHPDVAGSLNSVGIAYQMLGEASKGLGYYEQALEMNRALYPGNHPDVAVSLNNVGSVYQTLGEVSKGLGYYEQALEMRQALYPGNHPDVAASLNSVGIACQTLGESRKGLGYLEQALEIYRALYPGNHPHVAMFLNNVGIAYERLGEASKGLGYLEQALEMMRVLYPGNHPSVATSLNNVGRAYQTLGESKKGLGYQEQALEMRQALYPGNHPDVADSLNNVGSAYEKLGESKKGLGCLEQALEMIQALYPGNHPSVAGSLNSVGNAYQTLGESKKGLGYYEQALEMKRVLYPGNHPDVATSLNNVGIAYETLGESSKGLGYLEQALQMYRALYPGNHPDVADSLNNVGIAYEKLGESSKGLGYLEQALQMYRALYPGNHPHVANSLNSVGLAYERLGEASKGLGCCEQALEMIQALYPGNHPDVAGSLNNVGIAYERLGEASKGLGYYEQALEMIQALYPGNHPSVAASLNNVGGAYHVLGEIRKGLGYKEQALQMRQALYPGNHPDVATSLNSVGNAYETLGESSKGLGYQEQALQMRQALYPGNHPHVAASLNSVGVAYETLGKASKGLGYQEQALEMIQALYPGNHPDVATSLDNLGGAYQRLGEAKKGLGYQEQALEMRQALYPGNHPDVAGSLNNVGSAYQTLGESSKGLRYYEQALEMYRALYPGNHPHVATSLDNLGGAYQRLGEAKKGLGHLEQALEMRQALYPGNHPDVAASLNSVGIACQTLGESRKGLGYLEQALEMYRALYPGKHPSVAISLDNVGSAYKTLGEAKKGLGYYEQALEMKRVLYPGNHPSVAISLDNVGSAYKTLGEAKKGLGYQEQALQMYRALYPGNHPDVAASLNNVGSAYQTLGESKKGLGYFQQALEMKRVLYPGNHPDVAISLDNVGIAYETLGEASKGLGYQEQALQMYRALYPGNHPDVAASLNSVGSAYQTLGEASKGLGYFEQALEMYRAFYPGNHPDVATSLHNVGSAYETLGEASKGLGYLEQALEMRQVLYPGNHPDVAASLNSVGIAYETLGEAKRGLGYYEQALEMTQAFYPGNHPSVAASLNSVGIAYQTLGEASKGLGYQEQALEMIQALYPGNHPNVAVSLNNVGSAYQRLGEAKKGLGYLEQALEMMRAVYPANHPSIQQIEQNLRKISSQQVGESDLFLQACMAGNDSLAASRSIGSLKKDLKDTQGNPLICWMAQHEMVSTIERALGLNWNPNLPNTNQVYPLHYGAVKNLALTRLLLQGGAHPYVQTAKGNTPAQAARSKGKVDTLSLLLPHLGELSYTDASSFERSYQAYKQGFSQRQLNTEALLAALDVGLQLGDAELVQAIQAQQTPESLLGQLIDRYPLAKEAIQERILTNQSMAPLRVELFTEACRRNDSLALSMPMDTFAKDLHDTQGNPLICWMAQHEMISTIKRALGLSWNPNLANTSHLYPLHYGAVKNLPLTRLLLQAGAHPFVQTAKGNTPAQAARSKGKVDTLSLLLPHIGELSYRDASSFEGSYQAYKQGFSQRQLNPEALLAALDVALQLGDAELVQAVQARQSLHSLLGQLMDRYPLAAAAIQERFSAYLE